MDSAKGDRRKDVEMKKDMDVVLNVLLAFLIPMAIAGIWFLTNVRWWE